MSASEKPQGESTKVEVSRTFNDLLSSADYHFRKAIELAETHEELDLIRTVLEHMQARSRAVRESMKEAGFHVISLPADDLIARGVEP
jgi:hypothetical protein